MPTASRSSQQPPVQPQHPLELPPSISPDALDALTELASIISRVRVPPSNGALGGLGGPTGSGGTPAGAGSQAAATPMGGSGGGGASGPHAAGSGPAGPDISLKDLPHATDALKHKLQRARGQIKTLPDMGRSIAAQEETIADLEETIRKQREVLAALTSVGVQFGAEGGERMEM